MMTVMGQGAVVPKKVFDGEYIVRGQNLYVKVRLSLSLCDPLSTIC